jgi:NhaP-type Na+/H+ or K+/H+ antiporter
MEEDEREMNMMPFIFWIATGIALGSVYLFLIGRSVEAILGHGRWPTAALPLLLRIALSVAIFGMAARQGALPVLSVLAGFIASRSIGLRRIRES